MKKLIQIIIPSLLLISTMSCKKDAATGDRSTQKSSLDFNYNGKQYYLTYTNDGAQDWGASTNDIYINRPDIFGGIIRLVSPNCGYMEPYEGAVYSNANCELTNTSGMPIDSVVVYTYQSGSIELTYSNCETKHGYDIITGTNYTYKICDGNGTFSLNLKNKEDKLIKITNGIIKIYNQIW